MIHPAAARALASITLNPPARLRACQRWKCRVVVITNVEIDETENYEE